MNSLIIPKCTLWKAPYFPSFVKTKFLFFFRFDTPCQTFFKIKKKKTLTNALKIYKNQC